MPEGPPPGARTEGSDNDSDDDIPMPEGPPPTTYLGSSRITQLLQHSTESHPGQNDQTQPTTVPPPFLPLPPHIPVSTPSFLPPPPPPPPPPGFNDTIYPTLPGGIPHPSLPPGFFPRRAQPATVIQDPLSSIPHPTYQAHRASQLPPGHPSLPPKPPTSAIISAEPELRDLKKEATTFVPASLRRKKPSAVSGSSKVNAAPSVGVGSEVTSPQVPPDLVSILKSQLGTITALASSSHTPNKRSGAPAVKERDDYQKFVDEMGDLLGPPGCSK